MLGNTHKKEKAVQTRLCEYTVFGSSSDGSCRHRSGSNSSSSSRISRSSSNSSGVVDAVVVVVAHKKPDARTQRSGFNNIITVTSSTQNDSSGTLCRRLSSMTCLLKS